MMAVLLLVATLAGPVPDGAVTAAEAERLARSGRHEEALAAFRTLADRDPEDVESRVWMGRVLVWLGRRADAAGVFRDAILRDPARIDARVGLGGALLTLGRVDEALVVIADAEALAPESSDVLALKGRALRHQGRPSDALAAYDAAFVLSPGDADVVAGRDQARRQVAHRAHTSVAVEGSPDGLPGATIVDADVDLHLDDAHRVFGRVQWQERAGERDARAGGGVEWRVSRAVLARGGLIASPGSTRMARADVFGEAEWLRPRWQPALGVRYLDFAGARVVILAPSVSLDLSDTLAVSARFYRSESRFVTTHQSAGNNSGALLVRWRQQPRLWLTGVYARGNESFDILSIDRLGRFRADTVAGGARIDLPSLTSMAVGLEHQWRTGGRRMMRLTVDLVHHLDRRR